jgi:DNA-binding response OmpR family regulator
VPKILIADDEPHIRLLLEQTLEDLEQEDVDLIFAEDGDQALKLVQEEAPDVAILDVMMPRRDGYEVCDQVKHTLGLDHVYVIMLTSKGQVFDRDRAAKVGADVYITKPFKPREVIHLVREALKL